MAKSIPLLRAAILEALPESWTTVRDLAKQIQPWAWQSVRNELVALAQDGLVWKYTDATNPSRWTAFYCKPHAPPADLMIPGRQPLAYTC